MHEERFALQLPKYNAHRDKDKVASISEDSIGNATTTTTATASSLYSVSMDDLLLLEVSDRFIDISNLVSPITSLENDFEQAVAIGGDEDDSDDDYEERKKLVDSPHKSSIISIQIYPDLKSIDDISELDVDEFLLKTRNNNRGDDDDDDDGGFQSSATASSIEQASMFDRESHQQQNTFAQRASERLQRLHQNQQQNRSQRFSRRNVLSSQQTDSYRLHDSASSAFDSPSIDDAMESLLLSNSSHHVRESTTSTIQRQSASIKAIQQAISVRHSRDSGGFLMHADEEAGGTASLSPQHQHLQHTRPPLRQQESFNSHTLSYHDHVQPPPPQQRQRPMLRSQESFNSHSLNYQNQDLESYHPHMNTASSISSVSNASPFMDRHINTGNKNINAGRTQSSVPNHRMDANDYIINSYNQNNSANNNMRHLHSTAASDEDELYDDFAEDLNHSNYEGNLYHDNNYNHGRVTQYGSNEPVVIERRQIRQSYPEPHQEQDCFNYNGNFQMQRGRYNQSERILRDNQYPTRTNGYDDNNRNLFQQQQSYSYRHVPSYAPPPIQHQHQQQQQQQRSYQQQQQQQSSYGLSQSYHNRNNIDTDPPTYRNLAPLTQPTSTQISSSSIGSREPLQLEIAPGVFATVRGAKETEHAVATNHLVHLQCMACTMHISCIADAEYVLCPVCKVVGPTNTALTHGIGGVGLGFRSE